MRARALGAAVAAAALVAGLLAVGPAVDARANTTGPAIEPLPAAATPVPGSFRTVSPARLLDTRKSATRPRPGTVLRLQVAGTAGVPKAGVGAVLLHLTVTAVRMQGYVSAYAAGAAAPSTSSLNFAVGRTVSNNALVTVGSGGAVSLLLAGAADLLVDVLGWVVADASNPPAGVVSVPQRRLLDTRAKGGTKLYRAIRTLTVAGVDGVPSDAAAVVLNLTSVNATRSAPVTVWPAGGPLPAASNMNTAPGRAVAAQVVVGLGTGGEVAVTLAGAGSTDLVVDLLGYVATDATSTSTPATGLQSTTPVRVLDTRASGGMPAGSTRVVSVADRVPDDATAAVLTLTSVPGRTAGGYLVAYANGSSPPAISDLNPQADVAVATQVVVPLGPDRAVAVTYRSASGDVAVDLDGYVRGPALPDVVPDVLEQLDPALVDGTPAAMARSVLLTANRYAMQTWWPTIAPDLLQRPFGTAVQSDHEDPIRRLSMEAFSLSASISTGAYDPDVVGATQDAAVNVVATILAAVACSHRANAVGGWGGTWQSMMWTAYAGRAAWQLWADLPASTQRCVQAMVVSEADFVSTIAPRYMVAPSGAVLSAGNTGAEEDSWYALAPALAVAMMPTAEQRDVWRLQEERLLIAAWARPSDVSSNQLVDGVALSSWLGGSNVAANGVVVNHSRVAPDYSTNAYQSVDAMIMATLAGRAAPEATTFGLTPVYDAFSQVNYSTPAYELPGGTVYPVGSATVYYPQGCDWGTGQQLPYALIDTEADAFGFAGADLPTSASTAAAEHLSAAADMQARSPSGAMYVSSTEYTYVGREEHTAQLAGQLYLADVVAARLQRQVSSQRVVPASDVAVVTGTTRPAPIDERAFQH